MFWCVWLKVKTSDRRWLKYLGHNWKKKGTLQSDRVRKEVGRISGWEDAYIAVTDSCWCMAKTVTKLLSNYPPIKINNLIKKEK